MPGAASHRARRRTLVLGGAAAWALSGCSSTGTVPEQADLAAAPPVALPETRQIDLAVNGHVHRLFVALSSGPALASGYPVLYALDGNSFFPMVAQMVRNQSARGAAERGDTAIVVGLGYATQAVIDMEARTRDYTPPFAGAPQVDAAGRREGGADLFLDFIAQRVKPLVARAFPVDSQRQTLFGHSYGGLLTLHALFTRPGMFQRHVAASPSIWWGDRFILRERDRFIALPPAGRPAAELLVTVGALEETPPPGLEGTPRAALLRERRQVGHARELVDSLQGVAPLRARFALFDGEDHGTTRARAAASAVAVALRSSGG